ncbi:MAG TPA: hypothetical protein VJ729_15310 [Nitrososphaeraceae archaeon]|nr:hypothetical protein [Nitrososphaeraceae archaeon]
MTPQSCLVIVVLVAISFLPVAFSPAGALSSVNIFPPNSTPYGLTYAEHAKNFWKWSLAMSANNNPDNDPTGSKCANGQKNASSPVFYLAGSGGGAVFRTCEVPAGKGLLIPVMVGEASEKELPNTSEKQLSDNVRQDQDSVVSMYLKIGDKEYNFQDLNKYRTHTDAFDVTFPSNISKSDQRMFGVLTGGSTKAVADGRYIITEPLARGTYLIHFKSTLICSRPDCPDPNFSQDVTYKIIAK